ncbi:hypothetical protein D9M71_237830 [compost metagenome]
MHQRGADHRTVDHAPGDHDVRPQAQGFDNAGCAEVGVGRDAHRWQGCAAEHFMNAQVARLFELRLQVITQQHGDLQRHPGLVAGRLQGGGAGLGVDPAGITDDPDVLLRELPQQGREHFDEVARIAGLGIFHPRAGHDRQGDFGQVIEDQIVQMPVFHQLRGSGRGIAPEGAGTTDANCFRRSPFHSHLQPKCVDITKQALGL